MAITTLTADSIVSSSNLTSPTNVYDDDASWAVATSNNATSVIHVTFPTPSGTPRAGTGLQNFTVKYRVTTNANTVTFNAYLYENGTIRNGGTAISSWTSTSTTAVTREITWDASLLSTSDGSQVELYVEAIESGGNPSSRTAGEFQYVDWDADYSVPITVTMADTGALTVTDGAMGVSNTIVSTLKPSAGDYTSISAWLSAFGGAGSADLVADKTKIILECYKGDYTGVSQGGLNFVDEGGTIAVTGFTCDATYNITIRTPQSERHDGTPGTGFAIKDTAYNAGHTFATTVGYLTVEGIEFIRTGSAGYIFTGQATGNSNNVLIDSCIFNQQTASDAIHRVRDGAIVRNCLFEGNSVGTTGMTQWSETTQIYVYNCTFSNWTGSAISHNTNFVDCWNIACYNVTSSPPISAVITDQTSVVTASSGDFVDAANKDYRPASGSSLIRSGTNVYASGVTTDINGVPRPTSVGFDVGAFRYFNTGAFTVTLKPSGGDYTNIADWINDFYGAYDGDFVANDVNPTLECYKGDYSSVGGGVNAVYGAYTYGEDCTLDATHRLTVRTPQSERHNGTPDTGFTIQSGAGYAAVCGWNTSGYVTFEGLEVKATSSNSNGGFDGSTGGNGIIIESCIVHITAGLSSGSRAGIKLPYTSYAQNNLVLGYGQATSYRGIATNGYRSSRYYNNIVTGFVTGVDGGDTSSGYTTHFVNNIAFGNTTDWVSTGAAAWNATETKNNASGDSTDAVSEQLDYYTSDVTSADFVDSANDDYHLKSSSSLVGAGVNLYSSGVTTDIDGEPRESTGAFSIGPDAPLSEIGLNASAITLGNGALAVTLDVTVSVAGDTLALSTTDSLAVSLDRTVTPGNQDVIAFSDNRMSVNAGNTIPMIAQSALVLTDNTMAGGFPTGVSLNADTLSITAGNINVGGGQNVSLNAASLTLAVTNATIIRSKARTITAVCVTGPSGAVFYDQHFTVRIGAKGELPLEGQFASGEWWYAPPAGETDLYVTELSTTSPGELRAQWDTRPEQNSLHNGWSNWYPAGELLTQIAANGPLTYEGAVTGTTTLCMAIQRAELIEGGAGATQFADTNPGVYPGANDGTEEGVVDAYCFVTLFDSDPGDMSDHIRPPWTATTTNKVPLSLTADFDLSRIPSSSDWTTTYTTAEWETMRQRYAHSAEGMTAGNYTSSWGEGGRPWRSHCLIDDYATGAAIAAYKFLFKVFSNLTDVNVNSAARAAVAAFLTHGNDMFACHFDLDEVPRRIHGGAGQGTAKALSPLFTSALMRDPLRAKQMKALSKIQSSGTRGYQECTQITDFGHGAVWGDSCPENRYWSEMAAGQTYDGGTAHTTLTTALTGAAETTVEVDSLPSSLTSTTASAVYIWNDEGVRVRIDYSSRSGNTFTLTTPYNFSGTGVNASVSAGNHVRVPSDVTGGNRSGHDPYGYIDGPPAMPGVAYFGVTVGSYRAMTLAAYTMPVLADIIDYDPLWEFTKRLATTGYQVTGDPIAPIDPLETGNGFYNLSNFDDPTNSADLNGDNPLIYWGISYGHELTGGIHFWDNPTIPNNSNGNTGQTGRHSWMEGLQPDYASGYYVADVNTLFDTMSAPSTPRSKPAGLRPKSPVLS